MGSLSKPWFSFVGIVAFKVEVVHDLIVPLFTVHDVDFIVTLLTTRGIISQGPVGIP